MADALARKLLLSKWQRHGFPESLPEFTSRLAADLPAASQRMVEDLLERRKTRLLDSHPAPRDRIRAVETKPEAGVFHCDLPATCLFSDFNRLAAELTYDAYLQAFGPLMSPHQMLPVEAYRDRAELKPPVEKRRHAQ